MKLLSEQLSLPADEIRIWPIMNRYNSTVRPLNAIDVREVGNKTVQEVSKQENVWTIFVETSSDISFSNTFDYMSLFNSSSALSTGSPTVSISPDSSPPPSSVLTPVQTTPATLGPCQLNSSPPSSQSLSPNGKQTLPSFNSKEDVMLFFKFYDHKTSTLRYVFRMHLPVSANLSELIYIFLLFIVVF